MYISCAFRSSKLVTIFIALICLDGEQDLISSTGFIMWFQVLFCLHWQLGYHHKPLSAMPEWISIDHMCPGQCYKTFEDRFPSLCWITFAVIDIHLQNLFLSIDYPWWDCFPLPRTSIKTVFRSWFKKATIRIWYIIESKV